MRANRPYTPTGTALSRLLRARRGEGCGGLPRMAGKATPDRHKIVDIIIDNTGRLA